MALYFDPEQPIEVADIQVELKPHVGFKRTQFGLIKHRLDQDVVFINGVWSGYVGLAPGSQICLIHSGLPKEVIAMVKTKVDEIRGNVSSVIVQVDVLNEANVEVAEEE